MSETIIRPCSCKHEYQDRKYGTGKRVFNMCARINKDYVKCRCTVCGCEITVDKREREC